MSKTSKTKSSSSKNSNKPRLQQQYVEVIVLELQKAYGYNSVMAVPRIQKIVVNVGVGEAVTDKKVLEFVERDLGLITGQKPVKTLAHKSIAGFKIREGMPIGCKVTLRRERMYEFLDRLINIAIPRIRDFRGLSVKGFDGRGNYNLGVNEQIIFPEIDFDKVDKLRGLSITIVTNAKSNVEAARLLKAFNFPFKDFKDKAA